MRVFGLFIILFLYDDTIRPFLELIPA